MTDASGACVRVQSHAYGRQPLVGGPLVVVPRIAADACECGVGGRECNFGAHQPRQVVDCPFQRGAQDACNIHDIGVIDGRSMPNGRVRRTSRDIRVHRVNPFDDDAMQR